MLGVTLHISDYITHGCPGIHTHLDSRHTHCDVSADVPAVYALVVSLAVTSNILFVHLCLT